MALFPKVSTTSWRDLGRKLAGTGQPPLATALAVGLGVAVGCLPIIGLQTGAALALAFVFRLNRGAALVGTLVWQPFTAPFILGAEYRVGRVFVAASPQAGSGGAESFWDRWGWPVVAGSPLIAVGAGAAAAALAFGILRARSRRKAPPSVIEGGEA